MLGAQSPAGALLFASGRRGKVVQVEDATPRGDELRRKLGDLFAPRGGRLAHYRPTKLSPAGPATSEYFLATLDEQLAREGPPLWLYLAGHGDFGEGPAGNSLGFWGQSQVDVQTLAKHLDLAARPVRVVVTSCYSGGFAELAFLAADPKLGPAPVERCGLFATTWDLEASGCDPNPDRRVQEGFALHMLHALRGQDRNGSPLASSDIDFDNNGRISLLEAHTRARIASRGIDVPTTTSERWLRVHARPLPDRGLPARTTPEDAAVIRAFTHEFPQLAEPAQARAELAGLEQQIADIRQQLTRAGQAEDAAYRRAAAELLARWPALDDPWHPDFEPTLTAHAAAIGQQLEHSQTYADYVQARAASLDLDAELGVLRGRTARLERYVRALDNGLLAARLADQGGTRWNMYQQLLSCERAEPAELAERAQGPQGPSASPHGT